MLILDDGWSERCAAIMIRHPLFFDERFFSVTSAQLASATAL